ncbi:PC4-domain-containing protein [Mytilinidion resinicola]|uniref:PC4-domain-containing protein n=1 Tax=Mytilinidion resinicola TaxID=574789 RepID=A0A6A6XZR2_9PEZI|nr:PC4-domain-containing protein [Mytilinidion resinicola]KAF2802051.1 PC4-domain-containing protein [Mytilinidion resinicola]
MAGAKKRVAENDSDSEIITKKAKATASGPPKQKKDSDGKACWELSQKNRISIAEFKGKTFVNIREYYEKDGKTLPGKKGIMLPPEQFATLLAALPQIENVLSESGIDIPRPQYDGAPAEIAAENDSADEDEDEEEVPKPKRNKRKSPSVDEDEDED